MDLRGEDEVSLLLVPRPNVGKLTRAAGNDANTKVLLHFEGADASTTITDSNIGGAAKTWTAGGNAQIDTAQFKFGSASLLLGGATGDVVSTPDSAEFTIGTGDVTVECWVMANTSGRMMIAGQCASNGANGSISFSLEQSAANKAVATVYRSTTGIAATSTTSINTGAWFHIALVITSGTLKLFVNGTQEGGDQSVGGSVNDASTPLTIGRLGDYTTIARWNGWIDEFRFSNIARWTANFTPPNQAYY